MRPERHENLHGIELKDGRRAIALLAWEFHLLLLGIYSEASEVG